MKSVQRREPDIDDAARHAATTAVGAPEPVHGALGAGSRAEDPPGEADRKFRGLLESAPDAMVIVDAAGLIVLVNAQAEQLFRAPRADLIGQPVEALVPPRHRAAHERHRRAYSEAPHVRSMGLGLELYGLRRDGTEFPVEISLSPLESGDETLTIAAVRDISARKLAESQLVAERERTRLIIESAHEAFVGMDEEGRVVDWNAAAEATFGWSRADVLGRPLGDLIVPERLRERHQLGLQRYRETRDPQVLGRWLELPAVHKDGRELTVELTISAVDHRGELSFHAFIHDITERKDAERALLRFAEALERSNAELHQFAYVASHDLQAPLRGVSSFCALLERHYRDVLDERGRRWLDFVLRDARHMQALVRGLLDVARVESQGRPPEPVDAGWALGQAVGNLHALLEGAHGQVTWGALPTVTADPGQLVAVFQNLVENSVVYRGKEPPRVHVDASLSDGAWCFAVHDNGRGIDPRHFERIFAMFQRLHRQDEIPGTGIGLAVCKRIVERHGGHMRVESALGVGSTFTFTIPADGPADGPAAGPAGGAP